MTLISDWSLRKTLLTAITRSSYLSSVWHRSLVYSRILLWRSFHCSIVIHLVVVQFRLVDARLHIKFVFIDVAFFVELSIKICSLQEFTFFKSLVNLPVDVIKSLSRKTWRSCHNVSPCFLVIDAWRHLMLLLFERILVIRISPWLPNCFLKRWPLRLVGNRLLMLNFRNSFSALFWLLWFWDVDLHCVQFFILVRLWNRLIFTWLD